MSKRHSHKIPIFSTQATATMSVALVLIILGITGLLGVAARNLSNDIRRQVGFVVILSDDITPQQSAALKQLWRSEPYVERIKYSSADDVMERWKSLGGDDGDVTELLGVNPFSAEYEIGVKPEYADPARLEPIAAKLRSVAGVSDVSMHADMIKSINSTMRSLAIILGIVAGALLLISFVLINNTVRLTVYARRFTIHTMKLVGATAGFIRRPFIIASVINGIVAGLIALVALCGVLFYVSTIDPAIIGLLTWQSAAIVFAAVFVAGILICSFAAFLAANKYLRLGYDNMFA